MLKSLFLAASFLFGVQSANAVEITKPKGVVELFTSQGCYSCPPADKFVGELAKTNEILALSWHVDYWDYLGWKDTFGSKANSERQYRYAHSLQERQVYTPQAIINGRTHTSGTHDDEIRRIVDYFSGDSKGMLVPVGVEMNAESLRISVKMNELAKDATLYMVFFDEVEQVKIIRGENAGKTIKYHNVVKGIQPLGIVKASGLEMNYPVVEMKRQGFDACALILQKHDTAGHPGAIIGVTLVSNP